MDILALVALKLNHLAHLGVIDDGAIAGEFLFDDLEDLLLVEFLWQALDRSQGLTTIAFYMKRWLMARRRNRSLSTGVPIQR